MDAERLRGLQAPLKKQYREAADSARIPAHAEGRLDLDDIGCTVRSWRGETTAGLHPAAGGTGELACSADMLLEALVACAGVTLRAVATSMGVKLKAGRVVADGHWDARGTLGVDKTAAVGLTDISLKFELDADAPKETLQKLIDTTERYCVIFQTLRTPPQVAVALG